MRGLISYGINPRLKVVRRDSGDLQFAVGASFPRVAVAGELWLVFHGPSEPRPAAQMGKKRGIVEAMPL